MMTSTNEVIDATELFTSDPVIVESSNAVSAEKVIDQEQDDDDIMPSRERERESIYERPYRVVRNRRDYSPGPVFRPNDYEIPSLINSASLSDLIKEPDTCAETLTGNVIYISNTPFHAADLEKNSWLLKAGIQDAWVQRSGSAQGFQFDLPARNSQRRGGYGDAYSDAYIEDGPNSRRNTAIARLGNALRIFKTDEEKYRTEKVKFLIAVQGRSNLGWLKLVVSHSRQAAVVDIFHEILNNHSILFVGAVLKDIPIPVEAAKRHSVKFLKVGSLKEAEEVGKGAVGVIC